MIDPKIYLAIDNCFASKRWTRPADWTKLIKDLGINYIEASADNECDPLYMDSAYLQDWLRDVESACEKTGVKIANLYSGHGTYTLLGLASPDTRNQERIQNQWLKVMTRNAAQLEAGLGFYCHAFSEDILQNPAAYDAAEKGIYRRLAELSDYAYTLNVQFIAVEQMYSPHQPPWTRHGTRKLLEEVNAMSQSPFYVTLDSGHQCGQRKFVRLSETEMKESLSRARNAGKIEAGLWLGPSGAYSLFRSAVASPKEAEYKYVERIEKEMTSYPYLFAEWEDGDTYRWLRELGCYSPVIHVHQTDGSSSSHSPFTDANNAQGIIRGEDVLQALAAAYSAAPEAGMPPQCKEIYLTLEIFPRTADLPVDIFKGLADSVDYWRRFIPKDGLTIQELVGAVNRSV